MSRIKNLGTGFTYIFRGFGLLFQKPKLWPWAILPTIINLILIVIILSVFIHYYGDLYGWLADHIGHIGIENPGAWYWHVLDGILWVIDVLFQVLIVLISLVILLIVAYGLSFIVAAPFNDALSERVETILTGEEPPAFTVKKFIGDLFRIVKIESIKAIILIAIPVVLFVLNVIPVIGGVLYVLLTLVFGAWDLGFAFADLPMGRKVIPLKGRWEFAKTNKWTLIGFGAGFIVPFFALIFAAPMVVGGTILYVEKDMKQETGCRKQDSL